MIKLLIKKIPFYYIILLIIINIFFISFISIGKYHNKTSDNLKTLTAITKNTTCDYSIFRLQNYNFVKPLLYAEPECESQKYIPIKMEIMSIIEKYKKENSLITASVYIRDFDQGQWITINDEEKYDPASLLKLPVLITYLRMSESLPGLMDKKYIFEDNNVSPFKHQAYDSVHIKLGNKYSIRQLLHYMIAYSDNDATKLLMDNIIDNEYIKTYTDFGLPAPKKTENYYPISVREYSIFLKALYNCGYLNIKNSQFALSLLTECDFKKGIIAGLPASIKVAHKFGERFDSQIHQLHESAIIYNKNFPFLLTIMSKGNDPQKLTELLSEIAKLTYSKLTTNSENN